MNYIIDNTNKDELVSLKDKLETIQKANNMKGGLMSGLSHLKSSIYDWNVEKGWGVDNRFIKVARDSTNNEILGGVFWSFTKTGNRHGTLRHIFLLEEARGKGVAKGLYDYWLIHLLENGIRRARMFANKPSKDWHLKRGMRFIAYNKSKQPFTYLPLFEVDNMKELGKKYDEVGPEKCIEMVMPEVEKQVNKLLVKGGSWIDDKEFQEMWGTKFDAEKFINNKNGATLPI